MYIVTIQNDNIRTEIHGENQHVLSGKISKGINAIDSFTMSLHPANAGFDKLRDFLTLVDVYNTQKKRYEFFGRVLYSSDKMSDSGMITKDATCESFFGFFCDSVQNYVEEKNWTVNGLLSHIVEVHNSQVEDYKKFKIGEVTVTDPNDNLYLGIQRKNTWETIKEKLLDKLGGEIRFRVIGDEIYIDYLTQIGEVKTTSIAVSKNMKSIMRERNPSEYITRLIPLGCKLDTDGVNRLDITQVNGGLNYIDDEEAIKRYGIHVGYKEWDDVTTAANLLKKGTAWLAENNRLKIRYTATALDLSLLGLDIDDFDIYNSYPLLNHLLSINDTARIIKKNIDICDEIESTIDFGEKFESFSEIQIKQKNELDATKNEIYKATAKVTEELEITKENISLRMTSIEENIAYINSDVTVKVGEISASVVQMQEEMGFISADFNMKVGRDEYDQIISMINASADLIELYGSRIIIESDYFSLAADGTIEATAGTIGGCSIVDGVLEVPAANITGKLTADKINADGIVAEDVQISGEINATSGTIGGLSISGNQIASGDDSLVFDESGTIVARNLEVTERFSAENFYSNKIVGFTTGATELSFDHAEGGTTVVQKTGTISVVKGTDVNSDYTHRFFVYASRPLPSSLIITVRYKVSTANSTLYTARTTMAAGETEKMVLSNYPVAVIDSFTPSTFTYTEAEDTDFIGIHCKGSFSPSVTSLYTLGTSDHKWDTIYAASSTIQTSDRNEKTDIIAMPEIYGEVFDRLAPVSFMFRKNKSGRRHLGLIAQDVKQALDDMGIDSKDFAAYCEWDNDGVTGCGLRYEEFVPLNIYEIQKLKARVAKLEALTSGGDSVE